MPNLTHLRLVAREMFNEALRAVDPGAALQHCVYLEQSKLNINSSEIDLDRHCVYSIAMGKAAFKMALTLDEILGDRLAAGVLSTNDPGANRTGSLSSRWKIFHAGHPKPNEESLAAARAGLSLLTRANEKRAALIFLISGGGSSMFELPISEEIDVHDLQDANQALINCGASISEINAVRRAFSAVKGGRLSARAPDCQQVTLFVSDVPQGEEANIASGPTLKQPGASPDALQVIDKFELRAKLPNSVMRAIESPQPEAIATLTENHFVMLQNSNALAAAASAAPSGFRVEIDKEISDQPIAQGCQMLANRLSALRRASAAASCIISGGEFSCPVRGDGMGGRSLETALRLACLHDSSDEIFVALCAGTDGLDGNSPAAGAIVDSTTMKRARAIGLDPTDFLARSDSYSFFVALGDTLTTGPTGTNVRDLRIMMQS